MPSGPRVRSGSSARSGTKTVPPLLTVWSTPWSKNWPKKVKSELYGGERPTSVVTFGMKSVLCEGVQPAGTPTTGGTAVGSGSVVHGTTPVLPWVRTGNPAACTAAGLVDVWSTMRLLMMRGCVSKTRLFGAFCAYPPCAGIVPLPGPKKLGGLDSALRNFAVVSRGNGWSAAANFSRPGKRLLHDPSTVRRP